MGWLALAIGLLAATGAVFRWGYFAWLLRRRHRTSQDAAEERPLMTTDEAGVSRLLCGKPGCDRVAETIVVVLYEGWSGILGACWEHHEDMGVLLMRSRAEGEDR